LDMIEVGEGLQYRIQYDRDLLIPRIESITASDGALVCYAYDSAGRLLSCTAGSKPKASYRYDAQRRLNEIRGGDHAVVRRVAYDQHGNILEGDGDTSPITGGASIERKLAQGRVVVVQDNSGASAQFTYRSDGSLEHITATTSSRQLWRLEYNSAGQLISVVDGRGVAWAIAYHENGEVCGIASSQGRAIELDAVGNGKRTIRVSGDDGSRFELKFHPKGQTAVIRANGRVLCRFRYGRNGMESIDSPWGNFRFSRRNGTLEFRSRGARGQKQTALFDRKSGRTEIRVSGKDAAFSQILADGDIYSWQDHGGSCACRYSTDLLNCEVTLAPPA
jgi:YD repeat-containing protein